jgi:hypothetical protein
MNKNRPENQIEVLENLQLEYVTESWRTIKEELLEVSEITIK